MEIAVVGLNHESAPIKIREQASFTERKKIQFTHILLEAAIEEFVILSTCNRSEIYICAENINESLKKLRDLFQTFTQITHLTDYLFIKKGKEAVTHLFQVTTGLNSLVIGEDQISGQVKNAHETALYLKTSKKILNKLFQMAQEVSKIVKTTTKISENQLSISSIAVAFLREKLGTLKGKKVLVVGTGEMSRLALNYLETEVDQIYLASRNVAAKKVAFSHYENLEVVDYELRYDFLHEIDVVISATASPHFVFKGEWMPLLTKEIFMMDIALPRDIDPIINDIAYVTLFNIDELMNRRLENEEKRQQLLVEAQDILLSYVAEFMVWKKRIGVDGMILALNQQCGDIKDSSMDYLLKKLNLNTRQMQLIDTVMTNALYRVVREPILTLKALDDESTQQQYVEMLQHLFKLEE